MRGATGNRLTVQSARRGRLLLGTAVLVAIIAGCSDSRPGAERAGDGAVGAVDTMAPLPGDTTAIPPDTTPQLPGGRESTPGASGPGTSVVRPTPADSEQAVADDSAAPQRSSRAPTPAPAEPADEPEPAPAPAPRTAQRPAEAAADTAASAAVADSPAVTEAPAPAAEPSPASASPAAPAAPADNPYRHIPKDTVSQVVYDGWKQYELNCARCHGEFALGSTIAPALLQSAKEGGSVPTKQAFVQVVCAGRKEKGMPAWCELGLEMRKIEAIYAYVKGRADGKISPGRPAVRPDA